MQAVELRIVAATVGQDALVDYYPSFWTERHNATMQHATTEGLSRLLQGTAAPQMQKDITGQGGRPSVYHTAFRMWLIEMTVRHRYGDPRGLVKALAEVFAVIFRVSTGQVARVRQRYVHLFRNQQR
jgi:hypothetical protein